MFGEFSRRHFAKLAGFSALGMAATPARPRSIRQRGNLMQRFLNIRDGCLGKSFADLGYQSILNLLMQRRADLAQGLRVGDEDKGRKVSAVGTAIELVC